MFDYLEDYIPILLGVLIVVVLFVTVYAVRHDVSHPGQPIPQHNATSDTNGTGLGIGMNGKVGVEITPGLVIGFDGTISPGIGL